MFLQPLSTALLCIKHAGRLVAGVSHQLDHAFLKLASRSAKE